jgi:hypothetical protein
LRCCRKEQKEQEKQEKDLAIAPISEDTVATVLATPDDEVRCHTQRISIMCRGLSKNPVLLIRIRIHVFVGHPDPLVRGMDPDPSIIMQK